MKNARASAKEDNDKRTGTNHTTRKASGRRGLVKREEKKTKESVVTMGVQREDGTKRARARPKPISKTRKSKKIH